MADFITLDMELADRYLPSICSISMISWENGEIKNIFNTYINPDCDIEPCLYDRHGIKFEDIKNAPYFQEIWPQINKLLSNNLIIPFYGNRTINTLINRAEIDYCYLPDISYGCTLSMSKRTWKNLELYNLEAISQFLKINNPNHHSLLDALNIGEIINKSIAQNQAENINDLFFKIGYAGGIVKDSKKIIYRAVKDNENNIYKKNFKKREETNCFF